MKLDVYVSALIAMEHMIIDVPENATKKQIVEAVKKQIVDGKFYADYIPELMYVENNNTEEIYYDA